MGLILDSSIVVAAERFGQSAYQMIETIGRETNDSELAISVITVLELARGVTRAPTTSSIHPVSMSIALRAGKIDATSRPRAHGFH